MEVTNGDYSHDRGSYRCVQCGAEGDAIPLKGELLGQHMPPSGWESEVAQFRQGDGAATVTYWFCSRSCRGRWLIATEGRFRQPR